MDGKNNGFPWFKHFAVPFIHTFLWIENLKHSETSNLPKVIQSSAQPVLFKESGPGDRYHSSVDLIQPTTSASCH